MLSYMPKMEVPTMFSERAPSACSPCPSINVKIPVASIAKRIIGALQITVCRTCSMEIVSCVKNFPLPPFAVFLEASALKEESCTGRSRRSARCSILLYHPRIIIRTGGKNPPVSVIGMECSKLECFCPVCVHKETQNLKKTSALPKEDDKGRS